MLIVLPKGRLLKEIKDLLEQIGISFEDSSRKLVMNTSVKDIKGMINIFRILRRSSNSHVLSGGRVKRPDIDFVKR